MAARSARDSGRSSRRRVSRPDATTSQTEAGTPEVALLRWGTKPIRCQASNSSSGVPKSATEPPVSGRRPVSALTSVDLPEPLAPIRARNSPLLDGQVDAAHDGAPADRDGDPAHPDRHLGDGVGGLGQHPLASRRWSRLRRMSER